MICLKVFFLLVSAIFLHLIDARDSNKIRLTEVKALTLRKGDQTSARRGSRIPQLKCVGGSARCEYLPETVQCMNVGFDGYDVQWECKTDMSSNYRFGRLDVSCEGYDYPEDEYILVGSCGLEYTLDLTEVGKEHKHGHSGSSWFGSPEVHAEAVPPKGEHSTTFGFLFFMILVCIFLLLCFCTNNRQQAGQAPTPGPRAAQGEGDWWNRPYVDPSAPPQPQPPGFRSEFFSGSGSSSSSSSGMPAPPPYSAGDQGAYSSAPGTSSSSNNPSGSRSFFDSFWGGAATGGLLGYFFGRSHSSHPNGAYASPRSYYSSGPSHSWGQSSNWFGPSNSYGYAGTRGPAASSQSSWSSSSSTHQPSPSSSAGTTRTASGFAGTKRR